MMTDVEIRQARYDDLDTLLQMRMEVLHEDGSLNYGDCDELEEASWQYYESALANGTHIACFATVQGKIVGCGGMCLHAEMPSANNPSGRCAYLTNIHVTREAKGYDVGRDIVNWLVSEAHRRGITKVYLESSITARYMFHSMGFRGMSDMMVLSAPAV